MPGLPVCGPRQVTNVRWGYSCLAKKLSWRARHMEWPNQDRRRACPGGRGGDPQGHALFDDIHPVIDDHILLLFQADILVRRSRRVSRREATCPSVAMPILEHGVSDRRDLFGSPPHKTVNGSLGISKKGRARRLHYASPFMRMSLRVDES